MALEFADRGKMIIDNIGGMYAAAKGARFLSVGGTHTIPKAKSAIVPILKESLESKRCLLDALTREADRTAQKFSPARPQRMSMAQRKFRLADLEREQGDFDAAQRHENSGNCAARNDWIQYLARGALRKLRNPGTRFSDVPD